MNNDFNCIVKVKKCLKCGAETNFEDDNEFFCSQCGAPVLNRCSNYQCQKVLNQDAKYCKYCGSPSTFKNYGIFDNVTPPSTDDLPF